MSVLYKAPISLARLAAKTISYAGNFARDMTPAHLQLKTPVSIETFLMLSETWTSQLQVRDVRPYTTPGMLYE